MNPTTPLFTPENKPFTVLELFEGHPERWTKGCFGADINNEPIWKTETEGDKCKCFCLGGAIKYIYGLNSALHIWTRIEEVLFKELNKKICVDKWNDAPERTFEDIINKCKELGI